MTDESGPGKSVDGVDERGDGDSNTRDPDSLDHPTEGPAMTGAGATPAGNSMDHWNTAQPNVDATKPETMPHTKSTPMPGETEDRDPV